MRKGTLHMTILAAFALFVFPATVLSQSLELQVSPAYPSAGSQVSASITSVGTNLNQAEISWYNNGVLVKKGIGQKNFSFPVGDEGNTIKVIAKIDGQDMERSIHVRPSDMDVLWEVVGGYEPPFYKGKMMPIKGSAIKVVALPQVKNERGYVPDAGTFTYGWQKDGSNAAGQSGYGHNSFSYIIGTLDRENTIRANAVGDGRQLSKSISVAPSGAEIHFYEYSNSYGPLYNKAIKSNQIFAKRRLNILAEPYFVFADDLDDPSLVTEWKLNGRKADPEQKNLLMMNIADNINSIDLEFTVDNKHQLLQRITRGLRLTIVGQ